MNAQQTEPHTVTAHNFFFENALQLSHKAMKITKTDESEYKLSLMMLGLKLTQKENRKGQIQKNSEFFQTVKHKLNENVSYQMKPQNI